MPKRSRAKSADFKDLRPQKRLNGALFSLSVGRSDRGPLSAVVVSKKVAVRAVDRNRLKRRAREAIRAANLPDNVLVFTARAPAKKASYSEIAADIASLIERAS